MTAPALSVENLHAAYGSGHVLRGASFTVAPGEVLALLGRNGAGKTTALRTVMGLHPASAGTVALFGHTLGRARTPGIVRRGMTLVLEDRGVFPSLSVAECLGLPASRKGPLRKGPWTPARVFSLFPRLAERQRHRCGQLSGGEQQMLAIGRALLLNPAVLLLDEPTQGLAPIIVRELLDALRLLKGDGMSLLLVEQNFAFATQLADRASVLGRGVVQWSGPTGELARDRATVDAWLGAGTA